MISCEIHDYVEIACMFQLSVTLTRQSGEVISGVALDTQYNANRSECIALSVGNETVLIPLGELTAMTANQSNPHFETINFRD